MATAYENYDASHIRRSPEAIAACRKLVLSNGMADEEVFETVAEVVRLTLRIVALTGTYDCHEAAFAIARDHTITQRERDEAAR